MRARCAQGAAPHVAVQIALSRKQGEVEDQQVRVTAQLRSFEELQQMREARGGDRAAFAGGAENVMPSRYPLRQLPFEAQGGLKRNAAAGPAAQAVAAMQKRTGASLNLDILTRELNKWQADSERVRCCTWLRSLC